MRTLKRCLFASIALFSVSTSAEGSIVYWDYSSIPVLDRSASSQVRIDYSANSASESLVDSFVSGPMSWLFVDYTGGFDGDPFVYYGTLNGYNGAFLSSGPLALGATVSADSLLSNDNALLSATSPVSNVFSDESTGSGFFGLRFERSGNTYYGWMNLTVSVDEVSTDVVLNGIAFNSEAGGSIEVGAIPEPSTVALLLLTGGATIALRRLKSPPGQSY